MDAEQTDDNALARRAMHEPQAFSTLYDRYVTAVYQFAKLYSNTSRYAPRVEMIEDQALTLAADYAERHFAGFGRLTFRGPMDRLSTIVGTDDNIAGFYWQLQASDSEAWLVTHVEVYVDMDTGQIVVYRVTRSSYTGPTIPKISREEAIQLVRHVTSEDILAKDAEITSMKLVAYYRDGDRLDWIVQLRTQSSIDYVISVDALTGEVGELQNGTFGP